MMCYKDQTFCHSDCTQTECFRCFTPEVEQAANEWWADMEGGPPIALTDFSPTCPDYKPVDMVADID